MSIDKYRDNNNFLRPNAVETNDDRLNILAKPNQYQFIDYTVNPTWIGSSEYWILNATRGDPKDNTTFKNETQLLLFGSYFFLSEESVKHSRTAENIMQVVGDFGGVLEIFLFGFIVFGNYVNQKQLLAKSIRSIYF